MSLGLLIACAISFYLYNKPEHKIERLLELADSLIEEENYEEAIIKIDEILDMDDANIDAYVYLENVYTKQNDIENLKVTLEKIIEKKVAGVEEYLCLADIYSDQKEYYKCREVLKRGVEDTNDQRLKDYLVESSNIIAAVEDKERFEKERVKYVAEIENKENELDAAIEQIMVCGVGLKELFNMSPREVADLFEVSTGKHALYQVGDDEYDIRALIFNSEGNRIVSYYLEGNRPVLQIIDPGVLSGEYEKYVDIPAALPNCEYIAVENDLEWANDTKLRYYFAEYDYGEADYRIEVITENYSFMLSRDIAFDARFLKNELFITKLK